MVQITAGIRVWSRVYCLSWVITVISQASYQLSEHMDSSNPLALIDRFLCCVSSVSLHISLLTDGARGMFDPMTLHWGCGGKFWPKHKNEQPMTHKSIFNTSKNILLQRFDISYNYPSCLIIYYIILYWKKTKYILRYFAKCYVLQMTINYIYSPMVMHNKRLFELW